MMLLAVGRDKLPQLDSVFRHSGAAVSLLNARLKVVVVPGDDVVLYIYDKRTGFVELEGEEALEFLRHL